jgi:Na+/H+-dicarboxylate symporter
VCCSNFCAALISQNIGLWVYQFDLSLVSPEHGTTLNPLWSWTLPTIIANDRAMIAGVVFGFLTAKLFPRRANIWALKIDSVLHEIFQKFVYVIPFFVAGFIIKLQYEGTIGFIMKDYLLVFATIAVAQFTYLTLAYFALSGFKPRVFLFHVRNMLPAAISGFSTMSSAATMPLTILGAEKNCKNKDLARSVVPAVTNVHLIGDCFIVPILIYATLKSFGLPEPAFVTYLSFAFFFMLAKFSVAGIPGGGIIVVLPLLQAHFGFTADMMLLVTALYIVFDPFGTCGNVLGNGAFAKLVDRLFGAPKPLRNLDPALET